jgi:hypothetical protein
VGAVTKIHEECSVRVSLNQSDGTFDLSVNDISADRLSAVLHTLSK